MADLLPLEFRQELVSPLLASLRDGESCALVGMGGAGKSRALRHLNRAEVRAHYLEEAAAQVPYLYTSCAALKDYDEESLFGAVLAEMAQAAPSSPLDQARRATIILHGEASRAIYAVVDAWVAAGVRAVIIALDEFDLLVAHAAPSLFGSLRALREAFPGRVAFLTAARHDLAALPPPTLEYAGFFELMAPRRFAVRPYSTKDAVTLLQSFETQPPLGGRQMSRAEMERLVEVSGGHDGLLKAAWAASRAGELALHPHLPVVLTRDTGIRAECARIWDSLEAEERRALVALVRGQKPVEDGLYSLVWKGVVLEDPSGLDSIFCREFSRYVAEIHGLPFGPADRWIVLNSETRSVGIDERVATLNPIEFQLVQALYENRPRPCPRDALIARLVIAEAGRPDSEASPARRLERWFDRLKARLDLPGQPAIESDPEGGFRLVG